MFSVFILQMRELKWIGNITLDQKSRSTEMLF